jgi:MFS family permease
VIDARSDARRLALARMISVGGSSAASVALSWYLWESTRSSAWVAAALLAHALVLGLVSTSAGALADRVDRRRLMVASDVLACIAFAGLALAVVAGAPPLAVVVLMALAAFVESPFVVASQAAIPSLVDDDDVPWANALMGRVQTVVSVIAPATGGAIAAAFGVGVVLGLNAVSFVLSAVLVVSIRGSFGGRVAASDDVGAVRPSRTRALRVAWSSALLRATVFPGFVAFIGVGFVMVAGPQLAESYGLDALGLGAVWGAWAVGAFVASFFVQRLLAPGSEFRVAVVGLGLHGVGLGLVALTEPLAMAMLGLAIGGVGAGITAPARQTIIQRHAADDVRAGVFGVMEAIGWTSFALSFVAAGALVDVVGIRWSYGIAALLFGAGIVLMLALRIERRDAPVHGPTPTARH